eukprot:3575663-Rhodomonas_salina.1
MATTPTHFFNSNSGNTGNSNCGNTRVPGCPGYRYRYPVRAPGLRKIRFPAPPTEGKCSSRAETV